MFIGSSSEWIAAAEYLQDALQKHCEADVWDQNVFTPTGESLGRLLDAAAGQYDFAALVFSPDDIVERRGNTSSAPRDNVILELGIFLGALGRDRVFMVCRQDHDLMLPTDLLGVSVMRYQPRDRPNLRAQINPVALRIRERLDELGPRRGSVTAPPREVLRYAADVITGLTNESAGVRLRVDDADRQRVWQGNLLAMVAEIFLPRAADSYVAWLRPDARSTDQLTLFAHRNLPDDYEHYPFRLDEGLAGRAWGRGTPTAHSAKTPHEWWLLREGCENMTYLCAPVGAAGGPGGILGVGSDEGFELTDSDLDVVQLFARLLATSVATEAGDSDERRLLRERVQILDNALGRYSASKVVLQQEVDLHDRLLGIAQRLLPDDPVVGALRPADQATNSAPECGLLRMNLAQILAVL
jgi:hypothetical protein